MNDATVARAQIALAFFYAVAFVCVLVLLILQPPQVDEFGKAVLQTLLGGLLVLCTQQSGYFFARQRQEATMPNTQQTIINRTVPPVEPQEPQP